MPARSCWRWPRSPPAARRRPSPWGAAHSYPACADSGRGHRKSSNCARAPCDIGRWGRETWTGSNTSRRAARRGRQSSGFLPRSAGPRAPEYAGRRAVWCRFLGVAAALGGWYLEAGCTGDCYRGPRRRNVKKARILAAYPQARRQGYAPAFDAENRLALSARRPGRELLFSMTLSSMTLSSMRLSSMTPCAWHYRRVAHDASYSSQ